MKRRKRNNKDDDDNGFAAWGGYMEAKKFKLREQFSEAVNNITDKESNIFNGISIFVNGYTKPSAEELKHLMAFHGGVYHHYHTSKTTYIIASNLPDTKIKQMGPNQKIIKPEWVTDCLQAGKLLDYSNYLLYTNYNRKQPRLNFQKIEKEQKTKHVAINDDKNEEHPLSPVLFSSYDENDDCTINDKVDKSNQNEDSCIQNNNNTSSLIKDNFKIPETKNEKSTRTLTANDPKFLTEFYNNSRLHHISTLGATFKQHVCNLREQSNFKFPERQKLTDFLKENKKDAFSKNFCQSNETIIMHIDMDCFFVSVGLRKRPELRGIPVAVTHSKGGQEPSLRSGVDRQAELDCYKKRVQERLNLKDSELGPGNMFTRLDGTENQSMSEIASCSYEARKVGVKNGMFMGTALKLCPNLQTIPYDFDGYKEVAFTLYNTIAEYTLNIEAVSCDEMFVNITELLKETGATVDEWATYIRSLIQKRTGCPCSTGFGQNRLQARVATKTAKPNGQFHLIHEVVEDYMNDIKVDDLPGVGRSTSLKLDSFGVKTCGDLQLMSMAQLRSEFGSKIGESLYNHCRGIDDRQLVYDHERKSVSAEVNYGIRFKNNEEAETFLKQLVLEVHSRLCEIKMKGKCITLKLMVRSKDAPQESSKFMGHGICDYITKSSSLSVPTNELHVIKREVLTIAQKLSVPPQDLRGIGIQISKLEKIKNNSGGLTKFFNTINTTKISTENNQNNLVLNKNNSMEKSDKSVSHSVNSTVGNINKENTLNSKQISDKYLPFEIKNGKTSSPVKNNQIDTPLASEIKNEKKNSPVKNNQVKRGRGRPRGRGGKTIERKGSNNGDLTKFLSNNPIPITTVQEQVQLNGIDMEVFAALPEDIQREILAEYTNRTENIIKSPTKNNITVDKNTETIVKNIENEINIINKNQKSETRDKSTKSAIEIAPSTSESNKDNDCVFSKMNTKEMKELLQNWVSSQNSPEICDIKLLGEYFKQLALNKKINNLFEILKFLFSEITFKSTCGWHKAYFEVVNIAQEGMRTKYGSNIWTYKNFKCKNKCHLETKKM